MSLVRSLCAVTLAALGAVLVPTGARAAEPSPDLVVSLHGLAAQTVTSAVGKSGYVRVTNDSAVTATGVVLDLDATGLDAGVMTVQPYSDTDPDCRTGHDGHFRCAIPDIAPNGVAQVTYGLTVRRDVEIPPGPAGTLTATVRHDGTDADPANDTTTAPTATAPAGPDLAPFGGDTGKILAPGRSVYLFADLTNAGSPAAGLRTVFRLPPQVTFLSSYFDACRPSADRHTVTCTQPDYPITGCDGCPVARGPQIIVRIATGTTPRTTLRTTVTVDPLGGDAPDRDPSDNTAITTIRVGDATPSPSPTASATPTAGPTATPTAAPTVTPAPGGPGGGGNGGGGGTLPITGPGSATVAGLLLVALGVFAVLVSRRRRTA